MDKLRKSNNWLIRKRVLWYMLGMLLFVGILMLAKYSLTGSVTISIGVISAIIIRNIHKIMEGYKYDNSQPRWFRIGLVFAGLLGTLVAIVLCKMLSEYVYAISGGSVTPWKLFAIVAIFMTIVFVCSWMFRKGQTGNVYRFYSFLMVITICLVIGQCTGSLSYSKQVNHEQWLNSTKEIEELDE